MSEPQSHNPSPEQQIREIIQLVAKMVETDFPDTTYKPTLESTTPTHLTYSTPGGALFKFGYVSTEVRDGDECFKFTLWAVSAQAVPSGMTMSEDGLILQDYYLKSANSDGATLNGFYQPKKEIIFQPGHLAESMFRLSNLIPPYH